MRKPGAKWSVDYSFAAMSKTLWELSVEGPCATIHRGTKISKQMQSITFEQGRSVIVLSMPTAKLHTVVLSYVKNKAVLSCLASAEIGPTYCCTLVHSYCYRLWSGIDRSDFGPAVE